jgi:hypothetical protein
VGVAYFNAEETAEGTAKTAGGIQFQDESFCGFGCLFWLFLLR